MITPVNVDLSEVVEEMSLTIEQAQGLSSFVLDRVVERYGTEWETLVNRSLRRTRQDYLRAMDYDRVSSHEADFILHSSKENPLPIMIEKGKAPFDEKHGFEASPKRKTKKDGGWYVTVPFRHATSEALAESGVFASILPKAVENIAKQNNGRPVQVGQLPPQFAQSNMRAAIERMNSNIEAYTHKSPIYAGLVRRDISSTNNERRGGYMTFRRVSDKSAPASWWHPGFDARGFMQRALDNIDFSSVVAKAIDNYFGV